MINPRPLALALMLALVFAAFPPAGDAVEPPADIEITSCGQLIPKKRLGYLTADLDCTGFTGAPGDVDDFNAGAAVYLEKKARLDLRGFTITGGRHGVVCDARLCRNDKPCSKGPCEVFNGTLVGSGPPDVANGIIGHRPIVHDLRLSGFVFGILSIDKLHLSNATVDDNSAVGVAGKKLTIVGSTITNNGHYGVDGWTDRGYGVRLTDSTVTGNGTDPSCGTNPCADLAGMKRPRLQSSTCGTSLNIHEGGSWGVCTLD